jgi:polyhydroxyalkanoate synthase
LCDAKCRRFLKELALVVPDQASSADPLVKAGQAALETFLKALTAKAGSELAAQIQAYGAASSRIAQLQADLYQKHLNLWHSMLGQAQGNGGAKPAPVAVPERGDRRFSSQEWTSNPYFDYIRQTYLLNSRFLSDCVEALELEPVAKERMRFATKQFIDAMSPANFAATNPEALKRALETNGESLTRGIRNLAQDMSKGRISMTDESVFEVGHNVAVTPGSVVFQNDLIQLIQYAPLTAEVYTRPLLMVPPCINKYYVLDLQPENSLVRYAVEQGHTVFMVSWRNITEEYGHLTWDEYLQRGVMDAVQVALDISKSPDLNILGFCVGGTLVGAALAIMAARGDERVASLTFLSSMLDFSDTGEIGLFVDKASVAAREASIGSGGLMPGRDLALLFSSLRANDLIWPYVVNNYLKGETPPAFDLLFWNADATNLPGPMYCYYLRNTYLENNLRVPGKTTMLGQAVDLGRIKVPAYVLATREDHIVPWRTAYESVNLLGGAKRFVLGASGHIAGVINPASKNRRSYWVNESLSPQAESWLAAAREQPGSWWSDWSAWLAGYGGPMRQAKQQPGSAAHPPIEPAPGHYVKQRVV